MSTIASIDVYPVRYPEPHDANRDRYVTLARVTTDDGVIGWGEAISQWPEATLATKTIADLGLAPLLLGEDPADPRRLWETMRSYAFWHGHGGIVSFAISALDIALWDLAGKLAGVPVSRLLGGQLQTRVQACSSVILNTLDLGALREEFADYRERGFTALKGGWGQVPEAGFGTDPTRDVAIAEALRETVGPDASLALDVSARAAWTASHAVWMAQRLEPYLTLGWLEDALHHEDVEGWRRLRAAVSTPLATGERCWTIHDYRRLCASGAVDIVLVDPGRVEGISGMKTIVDEAAARRVRFVPHSWSSAVNTAAALHVFASSPNAHVFEIKPNPSPMQHELVARPFEQYEGWIQVPDTPGLGIEVDEQTVLRYSFQGP
jgi:L-alanine-DL-glutamate epimerase-like enolase superfamily enzyme